MMLIGIRQSPELFSTKNMIVASVAVSFCWLSDCISCMARSPIGVAALSRPSILAEMFMNMAPIAGWPFGIPRNNREKKGLMRRPKNSMTASFANLHDAEPQSEHARKTKRYLKGEGGLVERCVHHIAPHLQVAIDEAPPGGHKERQGEKRYPYPV